MLYILVIISSGLILGWLLGANDTVNLFGSSVKSEMLNIKSATLIASIFIIIGAVFQGKGTTSTIHNLANISDATSAFIVALSAALVVFVLNKKSFPVSTSQAIVGSIAGWSLYTKSLNNSVDFFPFIIAWILAPMIGILLSMLFYKLVRSFIKRSKIHLIQLDWLLKIALLLGIAFSAYSLGANNIGNVMGVFAGLAPDLILDFGFFRIDGLQILFLFGAISIATGIYTYSLRPNSRNTYGHLSLMPEATVVVLFTQALVLLIFSTSFFWSFLGFLDISFKLVVPVSSTQIVVGSVIGIGIMKGSREIENKTLAGIGFGWLTAPLIAGLVSFVLLYIARQIFGFNIKINEIIQGTVPGSDNLPEKPSIISMFWPGVSIIILAIILTFIYLLFRQQKYRLKAEKDILIQQNKLYESQKAMNELEMQTIAMENETLNVKLQAKRKEFMDIALNINDQRVFLENILNGINETIHANDDNRKTEKLKELSLLIRQKMSFTQEKKEFYVHIEEMHKDFHFRLKTNFPNLTELERRLAGLIRLNLSTKEISSLLNISQKSVEVSRYRLKKKMNLDKEKTLIEFINNL